MTAVELRLSHKTVEMLWDNAHIAGARWSQDGPADASDVPSGGDSDMILNRAATRWFRAATRARMGRGWQYRGPARPADVSHILDYIDSVAGALEGAEDAESRAEARAYRDQVARVVGHLRRQGAGVDIEVGEAGIRTFYVSVPPQHR
jgi:hypothetical protein